MLHQHVFVSILKSKDSFGIAKIPFNYFLAEIQVFYQDYEGKSLSGSDLL